MEPITEDYISFETAKLLRAKDFNEKSPDGGVYSTPRDVSTYCNLRNSNFKEGDLDGIRNDPMLCTRPTQALVTKWLRIKHDIHIKVDASDGENVGQIIYSYCIVDIAFGEDKETAFVKRLDGFNTPEEAIEAAILYTLKNLIK